MNEKISISELAALLAERTQMRFEESHAFVRKVFTLIEEVLEEDKLVKIKGLGTFKLVGVSSRESVAVNTGERIVIEGYTKLSFTPETALRDLINKPFAHFEPVLLNDGIDFVEEEVSDESPEEEEEEEIIVTEEVVEKTAKTKKKTPSKKHIKEDREEEGEKSVKPVARKELREKEEVKVSISSKAKTDFSDKESTEEKKVPKKTIPKRPSKETSAGREKPSASKITIPSAAEKVVETEEKITSPPKSSVSKKVFSRLPEYAPEEEPQEEPQDKEAILKETADPALLDTEVAEDPEYTLPKRKTYMVPFIICLSLLAIILIAMAGAYLYRPQWLKAALDVEEGPNITFVTVDAKDVALTSPEPIVPEAGNEAVRPAESPSGLNEETSAAQNTQEIQLVADGKANPNDYKIVGLLETVKIESGKSLARMAKQYYGSRDLWTFIVEYNKDVISNPDNIPIGTTLKIPKLERQ